MTSSHITFTILGLGLFGVITWQLATGSKQPAGNPMPPAGNPSSTVNATDSGPDELERKIASMTKQLARLEDGQDALQQSQMEMESVITQSEQPLSDPGMPLENHALTWPDDSLETGGEPSDDDALARSTVFELEEKLIAEIRDTSWSNAAEAHIDTLLIQETMLESSLLDARCRSTLCRIETAHGSEEALERFMDEFPASLQWNTDGFTEVIEEADGTYRTVSYFSRDGYPLLLAETEQMR